MRTGGASWWQSDDHQVAVGAVAEGEDGVAGGGLPGGGDGGGAVGRDGRARRTQVTHVGRVLDAGRVSEDGWQAAGRQGQVLGRQGQVLG